MMTTTTNVVVAASEIVAAADTSVLEAPTLYVNWKYSMTSARTRQEIRELLQSPSGTARWQATYELDHSAHEATKRLAPDIYYFINEHRMTTFDLPLLLEIERAIHRLVCRKLPASETTIENATTAALSIDFFERAYTIHLQWNRFFNERVMACVWDIPPLAQTSRIWFVSRKTFLQRLGWLCPFAQKLVSPTLLLSGSTIPLCVLKHEVYTETLEEFLSMVGENYKSLSLDFYSSAYSADEFLAHLRACSEDESWTEFQSIEWAEDGEWLARNRRGVTHYFCSTRFPYKIQLIRIGNLRDAISQQHLDCVRASYDGERLSATASCVVSWMTRFIDLPLLFGSRISLQRKSKTVVKYAMRGFGFSEKAISGIPLPSTLLEWLREATELDRARHLPAYHPLYNPIVWRKFMTADRVEAMMQCTEI